MLLVLLLNTATVPIGNSNLAADTVKLIPVTLHIGPEAVLLARFLSTQRFANRIAFSANRPSCFRVVQLLHGGGQYSTSAFSNRKHPCITIPILKLSTGSNYVTRTFY